MKKILLSFCVLMALTFTAQAQVHQPRQRYRHQPQRMEQPRRHYAPNRIFSPTGEFRFHVYGELGYNDFGAIFMHEIPYHFSVGGMAEYQIGHLTSIGVGAEYYSSYGEHCHLFENMQQTYIHTMPIYANVRLTLPKVAISPFIEGRIGYTVPLGSVTCEGQDGIHRYKSMGLFTGGAVGIKIYRAYISCGVSAIDVVDSQLGFNGGRKDVITDYYVRLSYAF